MDRVKDAVHILEVMENNRQGSGNTQMLPLFERWLAKLEAGREDKAKPLYIQF